MTAALPQGQSRQNDKEDHPMAAKEEEKASEIKGNGNGSPVATRKKSMSSSKSADHGVTPSASADTTSAPRTEPLMHDEVLNQGPDPDEGADDDDVTPSESSISDDGDETNETGDLEGATVIAHEHQHPIANPLSRSNHAPALPTNPLARGRDFGGSRSGVTSPASGSDDDSDYFDTNVHQLHARLSISVPSAAHPPRSALSRSLLAQISDDEGPAPATGNASPKRQLARSGSRKSLKERPRATSASKRERTRSRGNGSNGKRKGSVASKTEQEWVEESGMMSGKKADALGDVEEDGDGEVSPPQSSGHGKITEAVVEELKMRDRKGFGEIY